MRYCRDSVQIKCNTFPSSTYHETYLVCSFQVTSVYCRGSAFKFPLYILFTPSSIILQFAFRLLKLINKLQFTFIISNHNCLCFGEHTPTLHIQYTPRFPHTFEICCPSLPNALSVIRYIFIIRFFSILDPSHLKSNFANVLFTFNISVMAFAPSAPIPLSGIHCVNLFSFPFLSSLPHIRRKVKAMFTFSISHITFAPSFPIPVPAICSHCFHFLSFLSPSFLPPRLRNVKVVLIFSASLIAFAPSIPIPFSVIQMSNARFFSFL